MERYVGDVICKGSNDAPIDLTDDSNWADMLDDYLGTFSDRVLYSRRLAGTCPYRKCGMACFCDEWPTY